MAGNKNTTFNGGSYSGLFGSLIGGLFSVGQNRKNREFEREEAEKEREWNEKMFNETNAWNLEMWNKENEYNTPEAQVQRMRDAGLNPMYYGLDGAGSAGDVGSAQALGYERASVGNQVNPIEGALQMAQLAQIQAQTEKTKSETDNIDAKLPFEVEELRNQVRNSKLAGDAQETINKYLDQQQKAELRVKNSNADVNDKTVEKFGAEIQKMDYEKTTMFIGWLETQEKILNLQKQRELTDKQMEELASLIRVNNATASKIGLDVKNYDDITVIGTASHTIKLGPVTIGEGEPITLGALKLAREHAKDLKEKAKSNKRSPEGQVSATDGSEYNGPIYD